ncbi:ISWI chromatin-remodeling complex ATPase Isw2p [Trichomonascus vanleenenianus]|uniref:ISWI chromatin-remodeling complex ATPase Isw2p n=1 Tax=Trichomonascus vanleenenianus TaxID=2268995 RepID=UPI003EC994C9
MTEDKVKEEENGSSQLPSGVSTPRTSNMSTPVPIELTKSDIDSQRRNYLIDQQPKLAKQKLEDSAKRFKYLIGLTDLFRHFIDARAKTDNAFKQMLEEIEESQPKQNQAIGGATDHRHRKTEKEEDAELLRDEEVEEQQTTVFTESPGYIHGTMRDYQIQGLNWMISLYENNISGILADEMGLGKTLQTVSFLGYLRYIRGISGPHIVIVPKSTLDNWDREFKRWTPEVHTLVLQGDKESRGKLIQDRLMSCDFDVCITSYEMVLREKGYLKRFAWQYIIVDEAHRIKNEESMLSQIIRMFWSRNRLLVTGTPLQNNLHELWALLNFILPDVFSDSQVFDEWFANQDEDQDAVVKQLHKVLRPFLLRRVKSEVEKSLLPKIETSVFLGMADMQVKWYQKILEKDIDAVNGAVGKREKTRLLNIVMQLRKCCNHPYLFEGAEPGPPYTTDEHLIYNCGKMLVLDKLLARLRAKGSRVLIFSQMSRMLDILEDYCLFRGYKYCRIDGQTAHEDRISAIDEYNKPGSEKFVFLLTTRAGGLGINLTTADTVVLYDSDWNPQADLQAMDRAHRIGQTKQVRVYRLVTENAIEEKVLDRANQKLRLDQLVIQQGRAQTQQQQSTTGQNDLIGMIQHGAENVFSSKTGTLNKLTDDDIENLLTKSEEKTREINQKYEKLGLDELQKVSADSAYEWNGKDFSKKTAQQMPGKFWINPGKRERKENYSIDSYYKGMLNTGGPKSSSTAKTVKMPKQVNIQDHQFFPPRLGELQRKEANYYKKLAEFKVEARDGKTEEQAKAEQEEIDNAEPLTEEEEAEKQQLAQEGFGNWIRRDFYHFIQMSAKHGRKNYKAIAEEFDEKSEAEIKKYASVFWKRYEEIDGWERYTGQIEAGEERARKVKKQKELIKKKVESYNAPLQQLQLTYSVGNTKKQYSEEEDRFLIVQMHRLGLDTENLYELIRDAIRESPLFRFDWFFLSRTPNELSRRAGTLIANIVKEFEGSKSGSKSKSSSKRKSKVESEEEDEDDGNASYEEEQEVVEPVSKKRRQSRRR